MLGHGCFYWRLCCQLPAHTASARCWVSSLTCPSKSGPLSAGGTCEITPAHGIILNYFTMSVFQKKFFYIAKRQHFLFAGSPFKCQQQPGWDWAKVRGQGLQRGFPSQWQGLSSQPSSVAFLGSAAGSWMTSGVIRPWQHPVWGVGPNYLGPYPYLEGPEAPCLGLAQLCWNHPRRCKVDLFQTIFKT